MMRNKRRSRLIIVLQAGCIMSLHAQQQQALSLTDAIAAATTNNKAVSIAKTDEAIAAAKFKQTDAIFLPQATFNYTALTTNNPLNAFGVKLQQKEITGNDFNPALLNDPKARPDFMTRVEVQQPLVNFDLLYKRKAAAKQTELYSLATQRTKEYIRFEVQKVYLQLQLAYEAKKVLQSASTTAAAFSKMSKDYFAEGLIQKSDLLNAQLQASGIETQITALDNNISNASDYLSALMNTPTGIVFSTDAMAAPVSVADNDSISSSRADIAAMQKGIEAYQLMLGSTKKSYLPRLNAFASYQFNNSAMFAYNANAYLVGMQLSWDIFKGNTTKNKIAEQQKEIEKMQEQLSLQVQQDNVQLQKAKRDAATAMRTMAQNKEAIQQAEEALRIIDNRFKQGLVKSAEVLQAQTTLTQKQMAYAEALYQYNLSACQVEFLTTTAK